MDGWTLLIAAHATGALLALVLGAVMALRRKGDRAHRRLGRVWMVVMYWVALSSFGITRLHPGHFSWIHGLSAWTFVSLTMAWRYARRGDVRQHRGWVLGSYFGLVGAFLGAVAVPQRLIPRTVVSHPLWAATATFAVLLVAALVVSRSGAASTASPARRPSRRSGRSATSTGRTAWSGPRSAATVGSSTASRSGSSACQGSPSR